TGPPGPGPRPGPHPCPIRSPVVTCGVPGEAGRSAGQAVALGDDVVDVAEAGLLTGGARHHHHVVGVVDDHRHVVGDALTAVPGEDALGHHDGVPDPRLIQAARGAVGVGAE